MVLSFIQTQGLLTLRVSFRVVVCSCSLTDLDHYALYSLRVPGSQTIMQFTTYTVFITALNLFAAVVSTSAIPGIKERDDKACLSVGEICFVPGAIIGTCCAGLECEPVGGGFGQLYGVLLREMMPILLVGLCTWSLPRWCANSSWVILGLYQTTSTFESSYDRIQSFYCDWHAKSNIDCNERAIVFECLPRDKSWQKAFKSQCISLSSNQWDALKKYTED